MNLLQARTELAGRGFDYLAPSRMTIMLNSARNDLEDYWTWPWLLTTTQGTAPLTIADLKYVVSVKNAVTDNELLGIDLRQLQEGDTDIDLPGEPVWWYLTEDGDDVIMNVWPVSAISLRVTRIAESPELDDDLDTPLIPARYHPVWIDLAVIQAYKDSDNFDAAQRLSADVLVRLMRMVERYESRNRQNAGYRSMRSYSEDD